MIIFFLSLLFFHPGISPTEKKTERAFSGKYLFEKGEGTYSCTHCHAHLFSSQDKYQSGAGWPSFTKPLTPKTVYYLEDPSFLHIRYEVLCRECNSYLGHVFHDGPPPKRLRYCINSSALSFQPTP